MQDFTSLKLAASYAIRNTRPTYVFDGPTGGYVVAGGKAARELMDSGLKPMSLSATCKAAR